MNKFHIITLGCSKNVVDSEFLSEKLKSKNLLYTDNLYDADVAIINSCTFIEDAKEESIDTIFDVANLKKQGIIKYIILTGCLSQRYEKELEKEIPEIDLFLGTTSFKDIDKHIFSLTKNHVTSPYIDRAIEEKRDYIETSHFGYMKISEGCDNNCTYCIIPKIKGNYRSRYIESLIKEAEEMAKNGLKELILIAQDTSLYGTDIYGKKQLHILLDKLKEVEGIEWIRIHYMYPEGIYDELIKEIKDNPKVLNYFDIPLQHISDRVLKRMNRKTNKENIENLINKIRQEIKDPVIRTTFIVGFPGETEEDFQQLKEFVEEYKIERLGVFPYSREENTPAYNLDGQLEREIKNKRKDIILEMQKSISTQFCSKLEDRKFKVLIDDIVDDETYIGRTYMDSPEIDGVVYVTSKKDLEVGQFIDVIITDSMEYDLIGVVENEYGK
ncbi:MAG: 30S ribosomal protein S12 methylthiotransferase RimO [Bacillota bacterium]|nr:30S ribosomal protein S12 methylthiotransferase RimO [Bacillota bacterium]